MNTKKRRGTKPSYLVYGGRVCCIQTPFGPVGILYDASANTYYCYPYDESGTRYKQNLSRDKDKAVIKFYQLFSDQKKEPLVTLDKPKQYDHFHTPYDITAPVPLTGTVSVEVIEASYWERVKKDLLERPQVVSRKTGIEAVSRLPELLYNKPITLGQLYKNYMEKTDNPLNAKKKRDFKAWWGEFLAVTGLRDTDPVEHVNRKNCSAYLDWMQAQTKKNNYSPAWNNHRIIFLRMVLKYNRKRIDNNEQIIKAYNILNDVLPTLQQSLANPMPITPENFWKLFSAANNYWKLILLLGLNTGSYFADLYHLKWSDFNLEKGELNTIRNKTKLPKCAMLWKETVTMLKDLRAKRKDSLPWLLLSNNKSRYGVLSLQSYWRRVLRIKAGLGLEVKFNHIRDAVKTAAEIHKVRSEDIALVLGWKLPGVSDRYTKRTAPMTQNAVDAIYKHFEVDKHCR